MKKIATITYKHCFLFLILFAFVVEGCEKTKIQFGQDFVDNSYSNIILVDSISAVLSTVYSDSVVTSGSRAALAGNFNDNTFGKITAKSFFEVSPPTFTELAANSVFDSLELIVRPDKSYYGDTTFKSPLVVYQLKSEYTFPLYQTQFYNNTDFEVDPNPLGSSNTIISPNNTDSVSIRLSDAMGQNLFDLYKSDDYVMQTTSNFLTFFKGLQLAPGAVGMHAIYGFKDSVIMRLHYHVTSVFPQSKFLDFPFYNNDSKQFNQVKSDRTGTPVAVFNSATKEIASTSTGRSAFTQVLTGFMAKLKFPTLRALLLKPDFVKIIRAELTIRPLKNSYNAETPLPPILSAVTTDQTNTAGSPLNIAAAGTLITQTGNLVTDLVYNENTAYTYDVTSYLQQQILISSANQNGLLLVPPSPVSISTLNRLIIGDQKNAQGPIQLKVYYVSVNP